MCVLGEELPRAGALVSARYVLAVGVGEGDCLRDRVSLEGRACGITSFNRGVAWVGIVAVVVLIRRANGPTAC